MPLKKGTFRSGTSNVEVPERNKAAFPVAFRSKTHLEYYASLFNSVEINRTFYTLPRPSTIEKWAAQVPEDFRFTMKLWREITHAKELLYKRKDVASFMQTVAPVGPRKGCLLVQFPAGLDVRNVDGLERLLADMEELNLETDEESGEGLRNAGKVLPETVKGLPGTGRFWRIAVELRNRGWYTPEIYKLLARYKAGLVLHDMPMKGSGGSSARVPAEEEVTLVADAGFVFKRYHGPKGDYKGSYSPADLESQAAAIQVWLNQGKDVYAYFNNTAEGDAPKDVLLLNQLVAAHQGAALII
jgi:uncharacterized protein YecE (DUF72 family)